MVASFEEDLIFVPIVPSAKINGVLIVPSISIGNVGQLAVDILCNSCNGNFKLIGHLWHPWIVPMAGQNALDDQGRKDPALSFEGGHECMRCFLTVVVYQSLDKMTTVVQFRSNIAKGRKKQFWEGVFMNWTESLSNDIHCVIILAGADSTLRTDQHLLEYVKESHQEICDELETKMKYVMHAFDPIKTIRARLSALETPLVDIYNNRQNRNTISGSGVAAWTFLQSEKLVVAAIIVFTVEGNNIPDSQLLYEEVVSSIVPNKPEFGGKYPESWKYMYG